MFLVEGKSLLYIQNVNPGIYDEFICKIHLTDRGSYNAAVEVIQIDALYWIKKTDNKIIYFSKLML